jgi:hypothetical protein
MTERKGLHEKVVKWLPQRTCVRSLNGPGTAVWGRLDADFQIFERQIYRYSGISRKSNSSGNTSLRCYTDAAVPFGCTSRNSAPDELMKSHNGSYVHLDDITVGLRAWFRFNPWSLMTSNHLRGFAVKLQRFVWLAISSAECTHPARVNISIVVVKRTTERFLTLWIAAVHSMSRPSVLEIPCQGTSDILSFWTHTRLIAPVLGCRYSMESSRRTWIFARVLSLASANAHGTDQMKVRYGAHPSQSRCKNGTFLPFHAN